MSRDARRLAVAALALTTCAFAQAPAPATPPLRVNWASLPQPAVPADPLELVAGNAQPVQDTNQRASIITLLANARALSNVRAYAYHLKTTFTSFGSSASEGSWQLDNASPGRGLYRWSAQGPGYSIVSLFQNTLLYSNQPAASIPLRLAQVRAAIFYVDSVFGPRAAIRAAPANLNGLELTCALVTRMSPPKTMIGGRLWDESEFCIDPKSGLLITYSPVPGMYILYDYSSAFHFHDKVIPGKFTITQAGHTAIEARTESISDAANLDHSLFDPSGLSLIGAGPLETAPWNFRSNEFGPPGSSNLALQIVVLHAMLTPDGRLTDGEILASSDSSLNQRALDRLANWQNRPFGSDAQPGASPQSHEVFFTFQFAVPAAQ